MSTSPNPQLVEALQNAPDAFNYKEHLEQRMKQLIISVSNDSFAMRSVAYNRSANTVAMLLSGDSVLRQLADSNGIDLRPFDNVVSQVQALILTQTNKQPPALKVAAALKRLARL